ncbi:MAG: lectin like domain-containing protein [Lachnospiraceae bacterium]|nr:lectin like domain-containing protein [Lachnospiraceae bacterium]
MKRNKLLRIISAIIIVQLLVQPIETYAFPMVSIDSNEELIAPSEIDDDRAIDTVNKGCKNKELANPEIVAKYLYDNAQENVIKQVPVATCEKPFPEKFDLRDQGYVTPVKLQSPWGTCWGFAAIAACESSILSEMGKSYDETGLDLSEHQLTYFSRTYIDDDSDQKYEGVHMFNEDMALNTGGYLFTASSLFASGIGPVRESLIPYRGKDSKTVHQGFVNQHYSMRDDWTIPSDYKFVQQFNLVESSVLKSPAIYDFEDGMDEDNVDDREKSYVGYDAAATATIKEEVMAGRAVSIAYSADTFLPSQLKLGLDAIYLNILDNKWTHYTFDGGTPNHAVTIVGWDDSIKSTDFIDHSNDQYGDGLAHQPEGNGAFIVKNSWGAETEEFPHEFNWGIKDENGKATGYFYLSYYDRSITLPESFRFDVTEKQNDSYMIDQYDYMPERYTQGWADNDGLQMANVYEAEDDAFITDVSCQTNSEKVSTTYQIYLLDNDAKTPDDGELVAIVSDDYEHAGYHKKKLDKPVHVKKGQRYSVIVTSCFSDGQNVYYEFLTSTGDNEEAVKEKNRKILYSHRGEFVPGIASPEDVYAEELEPYYFKGVVNEGESFVYADELGQWSDLSQIISYLQKYEKYEGVDFDNFSIKAYLEYEDAETGSESTAEYMTSGLEYKKPASKIYYKYILNVCIYIIIVALIVFYFIKKRKKKKEKIAQYKEMLEKIELLEKENMELKSKVSE